MARKDLFASNGRLSHLWTVVYIQCMMEPFVHVNYISKTVSGYAIGLFDNRLAGDQFCD